MEQYPKYEGMSLEQLARAMVRLKKRHEEAKAKAAGIWHEYEHVADRLIPDMMEDLNLTEARFKGVGKVSIGEQLYVSVPAQNKQEFYEWLEAHGYADLMTNTVNSSTLAAQVRQWIRDAEDYPAELLKHNNMRRAKVTKG